MRLTRSGTGIFGSALLLLLLGGAPAAGMEQEQVAYAHLVQDEAVDGFETFAGDDGVFDEQDEGFLRENVDEDETFEIGFDEDESGTLDENEVRGEDLNEDEALTEDEFDPAVAMTGDAATSDIVGAFGDDERLDANDEGFLREDIDDDNLFEIGVDEDESGTLEENEVLGTDFDEDEGLGAPLAEEEAGVAGDAAVGDFSGFAGDDEVFDANDEGFVSEDLDGDGTNEIGFDEDASGTLEDNEVLGTDLNEDEALTEDEFGVEAGAAAGAETGDITDIIGDDDVFNADDEGFLREDINNDQTFEIGFDEDQSGTLEENEVLGVDQDEDEALDGDEFGVETGVGGGFSEFAGDDDVFNADDEGFLREDLNNDQTFEVGFDDDESGTLEENEVLGSDLNNDEALTEDEFGL